MDDWHSHQSERASRSRSSSPSTRSLPDFEPGLQGAARRFAAELIGTFALTTVDAGGAVIGSLSQAVTPAARSAAAGLLIVAMVYALSNVSGAHFNPVVTLAFALRRVFPWKHVPIYWMAQFAGAIIGSLLLRSLFGLAGHLGATVPEHGDYKALVISDAEIINSLSR